MKKNTFLFCVAVLLMGFWLSEAGALAEAGDQPEMSISAEISNSKTHIMQHGETVAGTALRYQVPLSDIATVNPGRDLSKVMAGESINLPLYDKPPQISITAGKIPERIINNINTIKETTTTERVISLPAQELPQSVFGVPWWGWAILFFTGSSLLLLFFRRLRKEKSATQEKNDPALKVGTADDLAVWVMEMKKAPHGTAFLCPFGCGATGLATQNAARHVYERCPSSPFRGTARELTIPTGVRVKISV